MGAWGEGWPEDRLGGSLPGLGEAESVRDKAL